MAVEWTQLIKDIGIPLISIAGGWIGGMLRTQSRLSALEEKLEALQKTNSETYRLQQQTMERLTAFQEEAATRFAEKDYIEKFRAEEAKQWQVTAKALGRIEGYLEGMRKRSSIHDTD